MTDPAISHPLLLVAQPGRPSDDIPGAVCIYCRTDRLVYWPPASPLLSADCPGCLRREPVGRGIPPPGGRPGATRTLTTAVAHRLLPGSRDNDPSVSAGLLVRDRAAISVSRRR
jgi:hypothetical protein